MTATILADESPFTREFERESARLPGASVAWLRESRENGLRRFRERGWPGLRDESWRFFDLKPLRKTPFNLEPAGPPDAGGIREAIGRSMVPAGAIRVVFANGMHVPAAGSAGDANGVVIESLAAAVEREAGALRESLGGLVGAGDHPFVDLNAAYWADGAVVTFRRGHRSDRPVHLLFLGLGGDAPRAVHPRILVRVEEGAEALLVEEYVGGGGEAVFSNVVVELDLAANASIHHVRVLRERDEDFHTGSVWARLDRDARYRGSSVVLGGRLSRTDIHVHLAGEGSDCRLNGLYALANRGVVDHHTWLDHAVPHTTSDQLMKGVLGGKARGVFNGRIVIREGAQQATAEQVNQNLLLSDSAQVNTNPQLEIFADDVKCRHGATIGQLDEDKLFYLQSRGIDGATARRLLVNAFADEVLDRVEPAALRDALVEALSRETFRDV